MIWLGVYLWGFVLTLLWAMWLYRGEYRPVEDYWAPALVWPIIWLIMSPCIVVLIVKRIFSK